MKPDLWKERVELSIEEMCMKRVKLHDLYYQSLSNVVKHNKYLFFTEAMMIHPV